MKKTVAVIMAVVMALSALAVLSSAKKAEDGRQYPTIMVAGYSSSTLFLNTDEGQEKIWGVNMPDVISTLLSKIAEVGRGLGEAVFEHPDRIVSVAKDFKDEFLKYMPMNADGTSVFDVVSYTRDPAKCSYAYINEHFGGEYNTETEIAADIAKAYGDDGYEHIFCFQTDFRRNTVDCAKDLDELVENVRAYTGADKVNIYAVSHGGETTATYLSLYGYKNHINNAVLTVPAIGGAALAADVISRNVVFDEETLMRFIENGMMLEEDIQWLMKAQSLGFLDVMFNALIDGVVADVIGYWGSIWDFIPADQYEGLKNRYLDPAESAAIIEKSDYYHYELLPAMSESFNRCIENGTNIYIVAGTDNPSVTGMQVNSDAIIPVNSSTGALCAVWGSRFTDGYRCAGTVCDDESHNHLSPAMNIDASVGYLPEQTWYISGLFHGMTWFDDYSKTLCLKLLFSDTLLSVHSDENYPQFRYSTNCCYSSYTAFDKSVTGYVSADDTVLYVTNISQKYTMRLMDVSVYGADISFTVAPFTFIKPGETVALKVKGDLDKASLTTLDITVTGKLIGDVTPYVTRTQTYQVTGGEKAENLGGTANAKHDTPFDTAFSTAVKSLFCKLGLTDLIKMIYNYFVSAAGIFSFTPAC